MVGHCIPDDDEHWKLHKKLRKILDILLSPRIVRSDAVRLAELIDKHHTLYKKLAGSLTLNLHNLIHYPKLLLKNGLMVRYWTMRYEGNQKKLKKYVSTLSGTLNLKMTIATKQALSICEMFNDIKKNKDVTFGSQVTNDLNSYNSVEIFEITYEIGMFVVVNSYLSEKEFGEIKIIFVSSQGVLQFDVDIYKELTFDKHYYAYLVQKHSSETKLILPDDLPKYASCFCVLTKSARLIITKYRL